MMTGKERNLLSMILIIVTALVSLDVITDIKSGTPIVHLTLEILAGIGSLIGVVLLFKEKIKLRQKLDIERTHSQELEIEAEKWRVEARKYIEGLSLAIEKQLNSWHLTPAEKEVAFLLLKGLSLKEIADVRQTTEKTSRIQSMAIYSKSGLSGRSELAAYFLEDLLVPQEQTSFNH